MHIKVRILLSPWIKMRYYALLSLMIKSILFLPLVYKSGPVIFEDCVHILPWLEWNKKYFFIFKLHTLIFLLSGLAVSDIHKIQEEVDTYYHISIVETLASTSFVSLPAEEVTIYPNIRPEHPKILGIPIPGFKVGSNPPAITGSPIPLINYLLT